MTKLPTKCTRKREREKERKREREKERKREREKERERFSVSEFKMSMLMASDISAPILCIL